MIKNHNLENLVKKFNENKLSHIFLIETNDYELALEDIKSFIKILNCTSSFEENCTKCNICHLVETNSLPTLEIIYPDGQAIKKSQMEDLKIKFSHEPYITKYNIYVINEAEKFNASSANTMLKFIEEPEEHIIGFLITNNKENVINTIKSRCELIKAYYEEETNLESNQDLFALAVEYITNVEVKKQKSIVYNKSIVDLKLERKEVLQLFKFILNLYLDILNGKNKYEQFKSLESFDISKLTKRIRLVNDIIDKLNYNVNINLLLDYFVLRLED